MRAIAGGRRRVLIVDDDPPLCDLLRLGLSAEGFAATARTSAEAALTTLAKDAFDVVIADLNLPHMGGIELCRRMQSEWPDVPVVVMTAFGGGGAAAAAIRAGAQDFLMKPVHVTEVRLAVERALQDLATTDPPPQRAADASDTDELLGSSHPMQELRALLGRAASSDASVFVTGESGTGKELVARALHRLGRRREQPFVAVNCAAMPEALLESELFGHVRGAFTDAKASRPGLFVQANGGTIFLDEIGDMPLSLQPKLLRVLQERSVRPLGGGPEVALDVRIIAATNDDVEAAVEARRFRKDLFFRLHVLRVELAPLRDRGDDVTLLARHFAAAYAARAGRPPPELAPEVAERLLAYSWPGNVRELQNCMERVVALAEGDAVRIDDLPSAVRADVRRACSVESTDDVLVSLDEVERRHILRVLAAVHGNKRLAARVLGLDRRTLYRRLERYNVPLVPELGE